MEYEYPDLGALGGKARFGDLLERGVIRANDWNSVRSRFGAYAAEWTGPGGELRSQLRPGTVQS